MARRSSSFIQPSLGQNSMDNSYFDKKQPILYTNSSTKLDIYEVESEIMKEKYQTQYNKFYKSLHQRSRSQVAKLDRIIQDASDLNEILNDTNKWLQKKAVGDLRKQSLDDMKQVEMGQVGKLKMRWRNTRKMDL